MRREFYDPYHWLKDQDPSKKRDEILEYLVKENEYTDQVMNPTKQLSENIYNEFLSRIQETDKEVPIKNDNYYYYQRTEKGKEYSILCRKHFSLDAPEQILLDLNEMEGEYLSLDADEISPCHTLLAYALDSTGDEICDIYIKNVETGVVLEKIEKAGGSLSWADSKTLYYTVLDDAHRPYQLRRHILGTTQDLDTIVYEETDEKFLLLVYQSKTKKYLFLEISSSLTSEVRYLDVNEPLGEFEIFNPRQLRHQYSVVHQGNRFLVLTNGGGKYLNYRLCATPLDATTEENWKELLPYDPLKFISGVEAYKTFLVLSERVGGQTGMRVLDVNEMDGSLKSSVAYTITPKEQVYYITPKYLLHADARNIISQKGHQPYESTTLRYLYTSFLTPRQLWDFDTVTNTHTLLKENPVPKLAEYERSQYVMERIFAEIPTETLTNAPFDTPVSDKIPISLVYKKSESAGERKMLLNGYGSYGMPCEPIFDSNIFSILNRGYIYAVAHIRGGGENGRSWYETGKFLHKKNTFTDFIACADKLINLNYTNSSKLVIQGASAGGLLMGAVLNMRPDICNCAIVGVPFVDVINTMMDASIPLTVGEYEEWGDPNDEKYFDYMLSYSPYNNIQCGVKLPHIFVKAGLYDPRVAYWEPAKWVAKLRANMDQSNEKKLVLRTKMESGHFGASGRYVHLKELADEYAFFLHFNDF
ncbi:hypothetical protein HK098_003363 [Nowakowskiella sp. JEL0407]|nr:hypothetical protein HK098_003363 [Nowakowskiella sp. JEL0407]